MGFWDFFLPCNLPSSGNSNFFPWRTAFPKLQGFHITLFTLLGVGMLRHLQWPESGESASFLETDYTDPDGGNLCSLKYSDQISCSVVSDSLQPHESQHARPSGILKKKNLELFPLYNKRLPSFILPFSEYKGTDDHLLRDLKPFPQNCHIFLLNTTFVYQR